MLQQMRSLAKYIWVLVALVFVGGFLLYQTSGLMGRTPVTNTTAVAVVNGHEILYSDFEAQVQRQIQAEQQRQQGQSLSQDDDRRIENSVFDQLVGDILLQDEYRRRGITVSDDEIREFARFAPPPWIQNAPELQTEGRFDTDKYQRLLASPVAREQGLLLELEAYYRSEIPREKLYDEIAAGVYVTDEELWRMWQDQHDSAQVSYVAFHPTDVASVGKSLSDADLKAYFDKHAEEFNRPGRAVLSVAVIPKVVTAQDTALAKQHADSLRNAILKGAKFEDVAKSESADTLSGQTGGDLGRGGRGRFVPEFEKAAYALKPGEISQPVLTQFGYHLIRVDSRKGDTLSLRHILIRIQASEANATATDKKADDLSKLAASSDQPKKLDSAAAKLGLSIYSVVAFENEPATLNGRAVPGASAWAFGGATAGETSELFDDDNGYYLARLDSLDQGGTPKFDAVKEEVRAKLAEQRALEQLVPAAKAVANNAAKTSLDAAAAQQKVKVEHSPLFSRASFVPGLGQLTTAVGAAFSLNPGQVSQPVSTDDGVYVIRVDKRIRADSAAWVAQKATQKQQRLQAMRQQAIEMFLEDMRKSAKVVDHRKDINAALRRQSA